MTRRRDVLAALTLGSVVAAGTLLGLPVAAVEQDERDLFVRGGELFQANCAACHGTRAEGGPGPDLLAGPALDDIDIAYVDVTLRTGRMPIPAPSVGVHVDRMTDEDREAVVFYLVERFDLPGAIPEVSSGDPARGQELYVRNCAACHGAAGDGGISGAHVRVPPLVGVDTVAIAEATRVGPFEMPAFDPAVLSNQDIDDIIGYLDAVAATPRTLAGVREIDQIGNGIFALGLGLLSAVVVLLTARARYWYRREPEGLHSEPPFGPRW